MLGLPGTPWGGEEWTELAALAFAPAGVPWRRVPGIVRHAFTHFHLSLVVLAGQVGSSDSAIPGQWIAPADLERAGLPTLMKKAARLARAR